jgi:predicted membrane protein DUF2339
MDEKREFESIVSEHQRLQQDLAALAKRIAALEDQLNASSQSRIAMIGKETAETATPPPLPPPLPLPELVSLPETASVPESTPAPLAGHSIPAKAKAESLELQLGTYWFVRIGIVLLLTGLVFLGNYLYQNVIAHFGAIGKISLLYLGGGLLTALGFILERGKERLKGYARVVLSGGLASIYYITYAAHYVPWLQVIPNPVLAVTLLIFWAAVMVWMSERRRSEGMAIFSILLAYYASSISTVFWFTLVSNVALSLAAMLLLARHRWLILSFASLVATYGSYAYWHFFEETDPSHNLAALGVLAVYWVLFTVFSLFAKWGEPHQRQRYGFAYLNNLLFFGLAVHLFWEQPDFWRMPALFGAALMAAAAVLHFQLRSRPVQPEPVASDRRLRGMYFGQAIAVLTLSILTYFSGAQLAIITAFESGLLILFSRDRSILWRLGAALMSLISFVVAGFVVANRLLFLFEFGGKTEPAEIPFLTGLVVGAAFFFNGWASQTFRRSGRLEVIFYGFLGTVTWISTVLYRIAEPSQLTALLTVAFGFALLVFLLPETLFRLSSPVFFVVAVIVWTSRQLATNHESGALTLIFAATLLNLLWHWTLPARMREKQVGDLIAAVALVAVVLALFHRTLSPRDWIWTGPALSVGMIVYGIIFRNRLSQIAGQFFLLLGLQSFFAVSIPNLPIWLSITPLIALGLAAGYVEVARKGTNWFRARYAYDASMILLVLLLASEYAERQSQVALMTLIGAAVIVTGWYAKSRRLMVNGTAIQLFALFVFFGLIAGGIRLGVLNLILPITLSLQHILLTRRGESLPWRPLFQRDFSASAVLTAFAYLTQWIWQQPGGFYLTAGWSLLACVLFVLGMLLRERVYRFAGLGLLCLALAKIVLLDVWGLELVYRVISFMVLGVVLLVIGFLYTRYQDKIREWL